MARSPEDLLEVRLGLMARVSLDMERIEEDPIYRQCLMVAADETSALQAYLEHYITRERFLRDMPSTNGPGQLAMSEFIEVSNATQNDTTDPSDPARRA